MIGLAIGLPGLAQTTDAFEDGDFTNSPTWQGNESKFVVDNSQLRLFAPAESSTAYLSTSSEAINDATWEFYVKLDFNPSGSNYCRIYLTANQSDLSGPLDGYFVMIGGTTDEISLYKQIGDQTTKIIDGIDGSVNLSLVEVAIKVLRDSQGQWELYADVGLTGTFELIGTVSDAQFTSTHYFGIFCTYSSTRSDKFYFDNINVSGNPYVDKDPPEITMVEALSINQLMIHFNEPISPFSANDPSHYMADHNVGFASSAQLQMNNQSVEVTFSNDFQNGVTHTLTISGIQDLQANTILDFMSSFTYFNPIPSKYKDIIITEILADPNPQVGLPDAEFIELFNRSTNPFTVSGWTISDGNSISILPYQIILPGEYWVITSTSNVSKFGITQRIINSSNFPTLNNAGDILVLKNESGMTIDSINYDLSWYRSVDKQEGGWSLELIDTNNPCGEGDNWTSSENEKGGTPGVINSVNANKPDLTGPSLISVIVVDPNKLLLIFDEKLQNPLSANVLFVLDNDIAVSQYYFESSSLRNIVLELNSPLITNQLYTITVSNVYDCNGNLIQEENNNIEFAEAVEAESNDIIINEILFNPRPSGVDFLELYNKSNKFISLKNWLMSNAFDGQIVNTKIISTSEKILAPDEYLVLTTNATLLKNNYPLGKEDRFMECLLPSMPDDMGSIAISNSYGTIIDALNYDKDFHSEFLKDLEGVSLERISASGGSDDRNNWTSASSINGFATPGYINSNHRPDSKLTEGEIKIDPPIFSINDANRSFTKINFRFDQPGFVANVKIFDQQGRLIRTLANNEILSYEGFFRWEGETETGAKARAGYYLVWFEVFNGEGQLKTFRNRVVIALK